MRRDEDNYYRTGDVEVIERRSERGFKYTGEDDGERLNRGRKRKTRTEN